MCNLYGNKVSFRQLVDEFSQIRLPLRFPEPHAAPNLEPRDEIRPTDVAPVVRPRDDGVELTQLKWGLRPARPKAPPVINFRSEGRRFGRGRCLIPASHFFEFTGSKYPKTRWKFTQAGEDWFCIAGLSRPAEGDWPESFTMLTLDPGPDVAPYHDRQVAVLDRSRWAAWLDPEADPAPLLEPMPAGFLAVEQVSPGHPANAAARPDPDLFGAG
jgi:putative SOS response-associated peptidase YedK